MRRAITRTLALLTLVTSLLAIAACGAAPRQDERTAQDVPMSVHAPQESVQASVAGVQEIYDDLYLVALKDGSGALYRCYVPRIDWVDMGATYTVTLDGDQITSIR